MSDEPTPAHDLGDVQPITEALARETNRPIEQVAEIYANESAELERTARVKKQNGSSRSIWAWGLDARPPNAGTSVPPRLTAIPVLPTGG